MNGNTEHFIEITLVAGHRSLARLNDSPLLVEILHAFALEAPEPRDPEKLVSRVPLRRTAGRVQISQLEPTVCALLDILVMCPKVFLIVGGVLDIPRVSIALCVEQYHVMQSSEVL